MGSPSQGMTDAGVEEAFESPPRSRHAFAKAVSSGRTVIVCDSPPLDGSARAAGFLDIRGWAFSRAGLDGVFVYLDGLRYNARLGVLRTDLGDVLGVDLTRSGFDLTIELAAGQEGPRAVTVVARGTDGHAVGVHGMVDCRPEPELAVASRGREEGAGPAGESLEAPGLGAAELDWSLRERVLIAQAEASASDADARAARLEAARSLRLLQLAEDRRREVESSLSWRITRPLRLAKRMLRPARRMLRAARRMLRPARRALRRLR